MQSGGSVEFSRNALWLQYDTQFYKPFHSTAPLSSYLGYVSSVGTSQYVNQYALIRYFIKEMAQPVSETFPWHRNISR